jgi:hypothetical protein
LLFLFPRCHCWSKDFGHCLNLFLISNYNLAPIDQPVFLHPFPLSHWPLVTTILLSVSRKSTFSDSTCELRSCGTCLSMPDLFHLLRDGLHFHLCCHKLQDFILFMAEKYSVVYIYITFSLSIYQWTPQSIPYLGCYELCCSQHARAHTSFTHGFLFLYICTQ